MTFAPCFLWIFVGAPYIEWISSKPRLTGALSAIMAAVVGVILSLSIWFGLHVFFGSGAEVVFGKIRYWQPNWASINIVALLISAICYVLLIHRHCNIFLVLLIAMTLGVLFG